MKIKASETLSSYVHGQSILLIGTNHFNFIKEKINQREKEPYFQQGSRKIKYDE
jgi:hypothetical protein